MEISVKDHTVVISQLPAAAVALTEQLLGLKSQWSEYNVILEAHGCDLSPQALYEAISAIISSHTAQSKSFVLVDAVARLKEYPEELTAAPTQEEAFDLIEMEEIERDLGF